MAFTLIVFGSLIVVVVLLLAIGMWNPKRLAEITGQADEKRLAVQAEIEERDVGQMVDAQNEARRQRGKDELTEAEFRARADADQRASIERAKAKTPHES
jgi:hypothetical protein